MQCWDAEAAYEAIRASQSDVVEIAQATKIKLTNIQKVKHHLFYQTHLLDRYMNYGIPAVWQRFDSDAAIAEAWQRLRDGSFKAVDLQLLRHETAEAWYNRRHGPGYNAAHQAAERRFPAPIFPRA
jgi:hypothetical protein